MKKISLVILVFILSLKSFGQDQKRKFRLPIWTTHSKNTDILGVSFGILPKDIFKDTTLTRTYGVRLEVPGVGLLAPLMPNSPVSDSYEEYRSKISLESIEKVYGVNLSSGSFGVMEINGVSGALMMQYIYKMNGISVSSIGNLSERQNGLAVSIFGNETYKSNGISIALVNSANFLNGIQIGVVNGIVTKGTGIQIGIFNKAKNFKGLQIGLWNKNKKRSLPFINWQFKD